MTDPAGSLNARLAGLQAVVELADLSDWTPYSTHDIGEAYLADSINDRMDDIRQAITTAFEALATKEEQ